ncbi:MAG TPA: hypothetical protein EYP29_05440, partial [Thermoplasmata archaeon]|nr:hypothetical protein [Thermoplasmata archaeon]
MALSFILLFSEEASAAGRPYITIQGSSSKETPPGTQVSYEIEVENRGTTDNFNISLHYSNPDGEWTVYASATSLHINENSQKSFYVYVKPHKNDTMPDADDILQVTVKVKAVSGPDSDSAIVTTTCLQKYDIALETVDPTEKDAYPGDTVTFYYNITNPGNGQDTYYGQFTKIPSTWEERSSFDDGITLNRDEKATMKKVTVYVDKEAEQGVFQINVEFHSDGDNTKKRTVSYSVNVLAKPDFSVTAKGDNVKSTKPNIGVKFSLNITNTGNIEDSYTLWVDQSSVPSGWSVTLHSSSTDTIDPDETISKDNIITVKPPADLSQAPYGDSLGVEVHVTSTYNSSLNKTVTFTTEIEQVYKLDLEANVTTLYAKQGEERKVTITVKNTGNGQDKVSLSLSGTKKKWGLLGKQFVTVERIADPLGRDQQNVTLTITIPSDAQAIEEGYTIVVDATSSDPEDIVKASQPIKIYVEQVYGVTVEVNGSTTQEVVPDHSITYTI